MSGLEGVGGISSGIQGIGQAARAAGPEGEGPPMADFAEALRDGVEQVAETEQVADDTAVELATGGDAEVHDLMAATTQAELSADLLVQVRNRAVETYQEIMRLQL